MLKGLEMPTIGKRLTRDRKTGMHARRHDGVADAARVPSFQASDAPSPVRVPRRQDDHSENAYPDPIFDLGPPGITLNSWWAKPPDGPPTGPRPQFPDSRRCECDTQ